MTNANANDPWLVPSRQREFPLRELLDEAQLHGRREFGFLALAALFVTASVAMITIGAGQTIDGRSIVAELAPGFELPTRLAVPVAALALPVTLFVIALVRELYGSRRASVLVMMGLVSMIGAGSMRYATAPDLVSLGGSVAIASGYLAAHILHAVSFGAMVRARTSRWLRKLLAMTVAAVCGAAVFGAATLVYATDVLAQPEPAAMASAITLALGVAAYNLAFGLVDVIPFVALASCLEIYLRVGGSPIEDDDSAQSLRFAPLASEPIADKRLPAALVVEDVAAPRRPHRVTLQPFTSAELRFFTEGEEMFESN
jgi:uncharacterized PurR-regulated membrane protein YhhQ (DUF165 family)